MIYSKFRPIAGTPDCQSIAGAMQSFYNNSRDLIDYRLSPKLGREVVRICEEIGQQNTSTCASRPVSRIGGWGPRRNGVASARSVERPEILLLGVTGFIGQELARQLLGAGHTIRVLVRNPSRLPSDLIGPRTDVVVGDLSRGSGLASALAGIRCLYHLAKPSVKTWEEWTEHEIDATRRLAEACLSSPRLAGWSTRERLTRTTPVPTQGRSPKIHL